MKVKEIMEFEDDAIVDKVQEVMEEGWKLLAGLKLPLDHELNTPLGFLFTKERQDVLYWFTIICCAG
jgi:hypothetical protein